MTKRHKDALELQYAGNPAGMALALHEIACDAMREGKATREVWHDEAFRLALFALMEKAGLGLGDFDTYRRCAEVCTDRAAESMGADNDA